MPDALTKNEQIALQITTALVLRSPNELPDPMKIGDDIDKVLELYKRVFEKLEASRYKPVTHH